MTVLSTGLNGNDVGNENMAALTYEVLGVAAGNQVGNSNVRGVNGNRVGNRNRGSGLNGNLVRQQGRAYQYDLLNCCVNSKIIGLRNLYTHGSQWVTCKQNGLG